MHIHPKEVRTKRNLFVSPRGTEQTETLERINPSKPRITHSLCHRRTVSSASRWIPSQPHWTAREERWRRSGGRDHSLRLDRATQWRRRRRHARASRHRPVLVGRAGLGFGGAAGVGSEWPRGSEAVERRWEAKLRACWLMVRVAFWLPPLFVFNGGGRGSSQAKASISDPFFSFYRR